MQGGWSSTWMFSISRACRSRVAVPVMSQAEPRDELTLSTRIVMEEEEGRGAAAAGEAL